jgi:hypothetical protein
MLAQDIQLELVGPPIGVSGSGSGSLPDGASRKGAFACSIHRSGGHLFHMRRLIFLVAKIKAIRRFARSLWRVHQPINLIEKWDETHYTFPNKPQGDQTKK